MTKITAFLLISSGLALRGRAGAWMRGGAGAQVPGWGWLARQQGFSVRGRLGGCLSAHVKPILTQIVSLHQSPKFLKFAKSFQLKTHRTETPGGRGGFPLRQPETRSERRSQFLSVAFKLWYPGVF